MRSASSRGGAPARALVRPGVSLANGPSIMTRQSRRAHHARCTKVTLVREQILAETPMQDVKVPYMCGFIRFRDGCTREGCRFCHSEDELSRLYKKKPCFHFMMTGKCERGPGCGYYHERSECRDPDVMSNTHEPYIPAMCFYIKKGECPIGAQCAFCHTESQYARLYKTVRCTHFERDGYCKRGDMCGFIHGPDDNLARFRLPPVEFSYFSSECDDTPYPATPKAYNIFDGVSAFGGWGTPQPLAAC